LQSRQVIQASHSGFWKRGDSKLLCWNKELYGFRDYCLSDGVPLVHITFYSVIQVTDNIVNIPIHCKELLNLSIDNNNNKKKKKIISFVIMATRDESVKTIPGTKLVVDGFHLKNKDYKYYFLTYVFSTCVSPNVSPK
jgi:hypothetical protein